MWPHVSAFGAWPFVTPTPLKAGVDLYSHKRRTPHNSNQLEPLCPVCRERKQRGKCRTVGCKRKGK
jgi:hypothetical protein